MGPKYIKEYQNGRLYNELNNLNYRLEDFADVYEEHNNNSEQSSLSTQKIKIKNLKSITQTNRELSEKVRNSIELNYDKILVLGGDHSIGLGSLHGTLSAFNNIKQEEVGLIWIDAHSDINTPLSTASGNFHGQPLSLLIKEMNENGDIPKLNEFNWIRSYISSRNIVFIGLRDIDQDEVYSLKKYNIKAYSMSDVEEYGLNRIMNETFNYLNTCTKLHVSVDIDSLDPFYAPSTGTPVLGGLTLQQLMFIGNRINSSNKLKTLDLVEVNPLIYENKSDINKTVFSAYRTILSFFGFKTIGTYPSDYVFPKP